MNVIYDFVINRLSAKAARDTARAAATHKNVAADILGMIEARAKTGSYELTMSYKSMESIEKSLLDEVLNEFTKCGYQISQGSEGYKIAWPQDPPVPDELTDANELLQEHLQVSGEGSEVFCIIKQVVDSKSAKKIDVRKYSIEGIRRGMKSADNLLDPHKSSLNVHRMVLYVEAS